MKKKYVFIGSISIVFLLLLTNITIGYSIDMDLEKKQSFQSYSLEDYPDYSNGEWYFKPNSYDQLVQWYKELENQYPTYLEVFKANERYNTGEVAGNYDLYYVRITNESLGLDKPEVLFLGSPHGDETVGSIGLYWFTDWLMRKAYTSEQTPEYDEDYLRWLVDHREIYIEISHNPYGFDEVQRYDAHGWDLNREADYDGPGGPTGGIWASVPGQTLVRFVNNHTIRVGCDFHGGIRLLIYPWASTFHGVSEESGISGETYDNVPPDFHFYDAASLRLGEYMGDFGGDLNEKRVGTIQSLINYPVKGGLTPWAYAANVEKHPQQDPFVNDEKFGNYPGSGIFWVTPEMSYVKNPREINFGNDTVDGYGPEVRRFVLHQTDLAQPYLRWLQPTNKDEIITIESGESLPLSWQVNGSLVVDQTQLQWGTDPDPINTYENTGIIYDEYAGEFYGGTGWDHAENGSTNGVSYTEQITFNTPGSYYVVAKAKVDQRYASVIKPNIYGDSSYLRLIQERTNDSYFEQINGEDGVETITGQTWWYSEIIQVNVRDNKAPFKPSIQSDYFGRQGKNHTFSIQVTDPEQDDVYIQIDWGDGETTSWIGPYNSGEEIIQSHQYPTNNLYLVKVKAKDSFGDESPYAYHMVSMNKLKQKSWLSLFDYFDFISSIFQFFN